MHATVATHPLPLPHACHSFHASLTSAACMPQLPCIPYFCHMYATVATHPLPLPHACHSCHASLTSATCMLELPRIHYLRCMHATDKVRLISHCAVSNKQSTVLYPSHSASQLLSPVRDSREVWSMVWGCMVVVLTGGCPVAKKTLNGHTTVPTV